MTSAEEALERVWLVLESLSVQQPELPLKEAVPLAQKIYSGVDWMRQSGQSSRPHPDGAGSEMHKKTLAEWVDEANRQPAVRDLLDRGKLIDAIKQVRATTPLSLNSSKQVIDELVRQRKSGFL